MYFALDVAIVADREERVCRRHFGRAVKFSAVGTQQLVAVHALDRRRLLLPRLFDAAAAVILVPDDAGRTADLAAAGDGARLGTDGRTPAPDDVDQVGDEEVVRQSPYAAGRQRRAGAAARTGQIAVVRQQEPVRPVLFVHLVVRLQAVGAERVLADEHLRVPVGARAQPTFEELVVQLLDEGGLHVADVVPVLQRRHRDRSSDSARWMAPIFFV